MYSVANEDSIRDNAKSHLPLSEAPLFKNPEEIMKIPQIAKAFNEELPKLLFDSDNMPSMEDIILVLSEYRKTLIDFDFYRKRLNEST